MNKSLLEISLTAAIIAATVWFIINLIGCEKTTLNTTGDMDCAKVVNINQYNSYGYQYTVELEKRAVDTSKYGFIYFSFYSRQKFNVGDTLSVTRR